MRTLVVSDLHLGSALGRDVLRRPAALAALRDAVSEVDRLVLLGDVVELLDGRATRAMAAARGPLGVLVDALGRDGEILLIPGNHDHALVRPWLRARHADGKPLGVATRVPARATEPLAALTEMLRPAKVRVQYPGAWLAPGVYATHGHYADRMILPQASGRLAKGPLAPLPRRRLTPDDFERMGGPTFDAVSAALAMELPTAAAATLEQTSGALRRLGGLAAPILASVVRSQNLAPLTAGALGFQFRRAGLPAMADVAARLGIRAQHLLFGHVHRPGPLPEDDLAEWQPDPKGPALHNSGSWVYEPLLLAGARAPHPYWPGGAIVLDEGEAPKTVTLLDGLTPSELG